MITKCPYCETEQEPNCEIGDLDACDECDRQYKQFTNVVEP